MRQLLSSSALALCGEQAALKDRRHWNNLWMTHVVLQGSRQAVSVVWMLVTDKLSGYAAGRCVS